MAKIIKFHGESGSKLVLDQNASEGDYIDVSEGVKFDTSILMEQFKNEIEKKANEIAKDSISQKEKIIALKIENEYKDKVNAASSKIVILEKEKENLKSYLEETKKTSALEESNRVMKEYQKKLESKDSEINDWKNKYQGLKDGKQIDSTKQIGEDLEVYLKSQFDNAQANGAFENCTFEKINISKEVDGDIRKRKADFLFSCYEKIDKTKPQDQWGLIFKVTIEAKNHNESSDKTEKNEKHYSKLMNDQINEKSDYSLLVTTLEPNDSRYDGIYTPLGYKNMYVVRPWNMLSILKMLMGIKKDTYQIVSSDKNELFEKRQDFEKELNEFIASVSKSKDLALQNAIDNLKWIVETIQYLKKMGTSLVKLINHINIADKKLYTNRFIKRYEKGKDFEPLFNKIKIKVEKQLSKEKSEEEIEVLNAVSRIEESEEKNEK